jgi:hypothetical protein
MPGYKVSKDGKTVTVGSKTYSIRAFKNQFDYRGDLAKPGGGGSAVQSPVARKIVTPKVSDSPEQAKSRAEKKRAKAGVKTLNKAGLGKKLTTPKPKPGKSAISKLSKVSKVLRVGGGVPGIALSTIIAYKAGELDARAKKRMPAKNKSSNA